MTAQRQGLAFSQEHCSACHAIDTGISPKPEAPSFEAIINTPGLTARTLNPWLRNSHNFPEIMNFEIAPEQIDTLDRKSTRLNPVTNANLVCRLLLEKKKKKKKHTNSTPTTHSTTMEQKDRRHHTT